MTIFWRKCQITKRIKLDNITDNPVFCKCLHYMSKSRHKTVLSVLVTAVSHTAVHHCRQSVGYLWQDITICLHHTPTDTPMIQHSSGGGGGWRVVGFMLRARPTLLQLSVINNGSHIQSTISAFLLQHLCVNNVISCGYSGSCPTADIPRSHRLL